MSLRSSRPRAGDTASHLWAYSLDAGELIDKLDATNETALADLVRDFFSPNGQLIRIVDNHLTRWKVELLKLSDPVTDDSRCAPTEIMKQSPLGSDLVWCNRSFHNSSWTGGSSVSGHGGHGQPPRPQDV